MLTVGVVNNMPPAAIRSTERQFQDILAAAAGDSIPFQLRWYRMVGPRPEHYARLDELWDQELDGLIVTGAEPKTAALRDEALWPTLTRTIDWAARHTSSAIWSCLAAHAAVLHLDNIERQPSAEKIFGLFESAMSSDHAILANVEPAWHVPHSRWNDLSESELTEHGYTVLLKSEAAGVDTFIKHFDRSLFVFMQSHPEYGVHSLMREYQRDVARFHSGLADRLPSAPRNYSDQQIMVAQEATAAELAGQDRWREQTEQMEVKNDWRPITIQIYRNWLLYLAHHASISARAA